MIMILLVLLGSCKEEAKQGEMLEDNLTEEVLQDTKGLTYLKGNFLYMADAAVLQTNNEIYGVVIDSMMHQLNDMVVKYKKEDTDMVPVEIKGRVIQKPEGEEGWDFRIEIKEIVKVSEPNKDQGDVIKLSE